jgi:mannose-1-phosphate guanylyltransferase
MIPVERMRILTGAALRAPVLGVLPGFGEDQVLAEPVARGTAPALVWAAHEIARTDPAAVMISLHADHVIHPDGAFRAMLRGVADHAHTLDRLFTIGAVPTRPETGYGYIRPGARLAEAPDVFAVDRFVEKPSRTLAAEYVASGFLWNTGIFVLPARLLLDQVRTHTPELAGVLAHLEHGDVDRFFREAPSITIDVGVFERSDRVGVARADFAWDDIGTWDAVGRTRERDEDGNVIEGDAHVRDSADCIAWSEQGAVVLFGVSDLIVVRTGAITLVAQRARAADLKRVVESLPERLRHPEHD